MHPLPNRPEFRGPLSHHKSLDPAQPTRLFGAVEAHQEAHVYPRNVRHPAEVEFSRCRLRGSGSYMSSSDEDDE
jgi:hypothetical protein